MKYAAFFFSPETSDVFLQSSDDLSKIKKDQSSIRRWMSEMGVSNPKRPDKAYFYITENGVTVFERSLLGANSRSWVPSPALTRV